MSVYVRMSVSENRKSLLVCCFEFESDLRMENHPNNGPPRVSVRLHPGDFDPLRFHGYRRFWMASDGESWDFSTFPEHQALSDFYGNSRTSAACVSNRGKEFRRDLCKFSIEDPICSFCCTISAIITQQSRTCELRTYTMLKCVDWNTVMKT